MPETVKVSLLQPRAFRASKDSEYIHYGRGIVEMPLEHARAMGLTRRIVQETGTGDKATVVRDAFGGAFDERLTTTLTNAGYADLDSLRGASQDDLMAIKGIGPAAYERIQLALRGD